MKDLRSIRAASAGLRIQEWANQLRQESERGCVLISGSILDELLGDLLRTVLAGGQKIGDSLLSVPNAPLSTFSSRVLMARALGLLSGDQHHDLEQIRKIRNAAAHFDRKGDAGVSFSFISPAVLARCRAFKTIPDGLAKGLAPRPAFERVTLALANLILTLAAVGTFMSDRGMSATVILECFAHVMPRQSFDAFFRAPPVPGKTERPT